MSGHIRGHYRIDSTGRVEPVTDVNALAKPCAIPLTLLQKKRRYRRAHFKHIVMAGMSVCILGAAVLAIMPHVERAVLSTQAERMASARAAYIQSHPSLESALVKRSSD